MLDKIAIIVPVRDAGTGRAKRLKLFLQSWETYTQGCSDIHIILDDDDEQYFEWLDRATYNVTVQAAGNTLMEKCNTIALDIAKEYRYIAYGADDLIYTGVWEKDFIDYLSSVKYGMMYCNDTIFGQALSTHPVLTSNMVRAVGFYTLPFTKYHYFDNYWLDMATSLKAINYTPYINWFHTNTDLRKPTDGTSGIDSVSRNMVKASQQDGVNYYDYKDTYFDEDLAKIREITEADIATSI